MGYRSDVAIAIGNERVQKFKDLLNEHGQALLNYSDETKFDTHTVFFWEDIKWYDDTYPDVMSVVEAFKGIEEDHKEMVRLGEDWADREDKRYRLKVGGYWLTYTSPKIVLNGRRIAEYSSWMGE